MNRRGDVQRYQTRYNSPALAESKSTTAKDVQQDNEIKKIKRVIRKIYPEVKRLTNNVNTATSSFVAVADNWGFTPALLNGIAQGAGTTQRTGKKARMTDLSLNIQVKLIGAQTTPSSFRCIVVRESTTLGSVPSYTGMFQSASSLDIINVRQSDTRNSSRYHILYDKVFDMGSITTPTDATSIAFRGTQQVNIMINKKLNFETDYSRSTGGTVADIETNGLFLCMLTDNVGASDISVKYAFSIGFIDS